MAPVPAADSRRRFASLRYHFADREAAVRVGLRVLMLYRELEQRRARSAAATRHIKHRSRDPRTGFGGRGAPVRELDRLVPRKQLPAEVVNHTAAVALHAAAQRAQATKHEPREQIQMAAFVATLIHEALGAGLGSLPVGSADAIWLSLCRSWLADHELGWIAAAADWIEAAHRESGVYRSVLELKQTTLMIALDETRPKDTARGDATEFKAIAATTGTSPERARQIAAAAARKVRVRESTAEGNPDVSRTSDEYARVAALRWQALRKRGFRDTRK